MSNRSPLWSKSYQCSPEDFVLEVEKATQIHAAISQVKSHTRLVAPAVVEVDHSSNTIWFERLTCHEPLGVAICRDPDQLGALMRTAGLALKALHSGMTPPRNARPVAIDLHKRRASKRTRFQAPVLLHGDFGFSNVLVLDNGGMAVVDGSPNGYTSFAPCEAGDFLVDVALMRSCTMGRFRSINPSLRALAYTTGFTEFVRGYGGLTNEEIQLVDVMASEILKRYFLCKGGVHMPRLAAASLVGITRVSAGLQRLFSAAELSGESRRHE